MAISYVSQAIKSNPYILPFDQNLMAKVLQFKETNFIQNAQKIQQGINSLSSLQMKDEAGQQYLSGKINALVNKTNDFGAVDLGDANISNQIDHLVNTVPQDDVILTQVSGMKQAQNMMAEYEKFRTDPKMKGNYSDANYNWSMEKFNNWRNDKDATSAYTGPSTATPFFDLNKFYHDNLKNVKAQYVEQITPGGTFYFDKQSKTLITEGELQQIVNDLTLSDPRASQQSQINAWFTAKGKTPEMIVGSLNEQADYNLASNNETINYLKDQIQKNPNDTELKANYTGQIKNLESYSKQLKNNKASYTVQEYMKNPDQFNFIDYQSRTARAFGNMYKVNKQTRDIKVNQGAYLEEKLKLDALKTQAYLYSKGLAPDGKGGLLKLSGSDGKVDFDGIFQKVTDTDTDFTTDPEKTFALTEDKLRSNIANANTQIAKQSVDAIQNAILRNPNIEGIFGKELIDQLQQQGQKLDPKDVVFDAKDFQFLPDLIRTGKINFGKYGKDPEFVKQANQYVQKVYDLWSNPETQETTVNGIDFKELGLVDAFKNISNIKRQRGLDEATLKQSMQKAGLSEQESATYSDYLNNPGKYQVTTAGHFNGDMSYTPEKHSDNKEVTDIQNKLKANTQYLKDISIRLQPTGWRMYDENTFKSDDIPGKRVVNQVKTEIAANLSRGFFAEGDENIYKIPNKNGFPTTNESISDVTIYKTNDLFKEEISGMETRYYAKAFIKPAKQGEQGKIVNIPISENAIGSLFGNTFDLPMELQLTNEEVRRFGSTDVLYDTNINNFRVKFRAVKAYNQNGAVMYPKSVIQLMYPDKNARTGYSYKNIFLNNTFNSPAEAETTAKGYVDQFVKKYGKNANLETLLKDIDTYSPTNR